MAIKISGVTVIDDSRNLVNVIGLKTIGGNSILGSGNITVPQYFSQAAEPTSANGDIWVDTDTYTAFIRADGVWYTLGNTPVQTGLISGSGHSGGNPKSKIEKITIPTTGNAVMFGELILARGSSQATTDGSRSIVAGGATGASGTSTTQIDSTSITTGGAAFDAGNLTTARQQLSGCSNGSRGVWAGGQNSNANIEYAALNTYIATATFGTLTSTRRLGPTGTSNGTRAVFAGGFTSVYVNTIDYITIATLGNATSFGTLTGINGGFGSVSSTTRGVYGGGNNSSLAMEYITIATVGNATSFGNLTSSRQGPGGCSNGTRGVFSGGQGGDSIVIDYITIASVGNATSFGSLGTNAGQPASTSGFYGV